MRLHLLTLAAAASLALGGQAHALIDVVFSEGFDVTLGESVNERLTDPEVFITYGERVSTDPDSIPRPNSFTHTPPAGWTVDNDYDVNGLLPLVGERRRREQGKSRR